MTYKNNTASALELRRSSDLTPEVLGERAREAAEEILVAGEAANTRASYESALRYWCAWYAVRYGRQLSLPVPGPVVIQFVVDHVARERKGQLVSELPKALDQKLVDAGSKGQLGPLKMNTVRHRLSVLAKVHDLAKLQPNPCRDPALVHLMTRARRAAAKRGDTTRKKPALIKEPLQLILATCKEDLKGKRDRALLLFGWSSGGRRRSEIANATMDRLRRVSHEEYAYSLGHSKTQQAGAGADSTDKPVVGEAARALTTWLEAAGITEGPIFRRLWKTSVGGALNAGSVRKILIDRAKLAGVEGDWSAHSLRSGFATECGRQGVPIGDGMAMTNHSHVGSFIGYYRSGEVSRGRAAQLLDAPTIKSASVEE